MKLTAPDGARLISASSPVAGVTELHEMRMDGDVMRMRAVPGIDLLPKQAVELKPGGLHVMLMDLKQALPKDTEVPITLHYRDAHGREGRLELKVPVAATAPARR